ncbi:glycosyltransferase [Microbacterium sp. MTN4-26]|uniref:glycosyltransferase n=1 Tax=unclassified Microbacterium TaxID=2609290 RepID=UPI0036F28D3F
MSWKGGALLLHALTLTESPVRAVFYGVGPDQRRLTKLARKLGVTNRVEFVGKLARGDLWQRMATARALIHPSFHDACAWSVAEALRIGLPTVVLDLAGPEVLVRSAGGTPVRHDDRELPAKLAQLLDHPPQSITTELWADNTYRARLAEKLRRVASSRSTTSDDGQAGLS